MLKRLFIVITFLVCLSAAHIPVEAQEQLTEEFVSYDSWLTFNYPSSWVLNSDGDDFGAGFLFLGSSSKALQTMLSNGANKLSKTVPAGDVGIILVRSRYLNSRLKLTSDTTPTDVLKQFVGVALSLTSGDIQETTIAGYAAARLDSSDKNSAGVFLSVNLGYNERVVMIASTAPKDLNKFESIILSIASSLRWGGNAQKLLIHDNPVWQVVWSPDGRYLATRENDKKSKQNTVHIWNSNSFEELYSAPAEGFVWSLDSQRLLVWEVNNSTRILNAATGDVLATMPRSSDAKWSADGGRILTTSYQDKVVKVWDVTSTPAKPLANIAVQTSFMYWGKDDTVVITSIGGLSAEWLTQVWDANTGSELLNVLDTDRVIFNQNSTHVLVPLRSGSIQVYDFVTGTPILNMPVKLDKDIFGQHIHQAAWRADEKIITANAGSCTGTQNCTLDLWIWDAETGELLHRLAKDEPFRSAAWNPDGSQVLTLSRQPHRVLVWDVKSGEMLFALDHPDYAQGAIWKKDGSKFITWSAEGIARLWNSKTGKLVMTMPHDTEIDSVSWSADETLIYTRTINGMQRTWDALTGRVLLQVGGGGKGDRDIPAWRADSPNDMQLVTWVSGEPGVRVWDNKTMLFLARVKSEGDPLLTGDYIKQSTEAINNGDLDKALAILKHVEQLDPDLARVYNLRGIVYYRMKDIQRAVDEIKRAVQIDPAYVQGYINLGNILGIAGDWSAAIKNYTRAIELEPANAGIYNERGVTYFKWNKTYLQNAIDDFTKAVELKPDYATAYENRGNMYYILKEYKKALDDYHEYARLAGDKANKTILERIAELETKTK